MYGNHSRDLKANPDEDSRFKTQKSDPPVDPRVSVPQLNNDGPYTI